MSGIKAIETSFRGYRFRSRLEARWAVFFTELGLKRDYEPEGFELGKHGRYLPDFFLPEFNVFVEIKPFDKSPHKCDVFRDLIGPIILCCGIPGNTYPVLYCNDVSSSTAGPYDSKGMFTTGFGYDPVNSVMLPSIPRFVVFDSIGREFTSFTGKFIPDANRIIGLQNSFTYMDIPGSETERLDETIRIYNSNLSWAYNAAKSARFEFGESGA